MTDRELVEEVEIIATQGQRQGILKRAKDEMLKSAILSPSVRNGLFSTIHQHKRQADKTVIMPPMPATANPVPTPAQREQVQALLRGEAKPTAAPSASASRPPTIRKPPGYWTFERIRDVAIGNKITKLASLKRVDSRAYATLFGRFKSRIPELRTALEVNRRCNKCLEVKSLECFNNDAKGRGGKRSACKACAASYTRGYYLRKKAKGPMSHVPTIPNSWYKNPTVVYISAALSVATSCVLYFLK